MATRSLFEMSGGEMRKWPVNHGDMYNPVYILKTTVPF